MNLLELLGEQSRVLEAGGSDVGGLELAQRLCVELRLELLEYVCEFWMAEGCKYISYSRMGLSYSRKTRMSLSEAARRPMGAAEMRAGRAAARRAGA
jgi:hypothetical protein